MYGPERNSQFCFLESQDVCRDEIEGNIRTRGKTKLTSFPRDHALSVLYFPLDNHIIKKKKRRRHNLFIGNRQSSWREHVLRIMPILIKACTDHVLLYSAHGQQLRSCIAVGLHLNLIRGT